MVDRVGEVNHERLQETPLLAPTKVFERLWYMYGVFEVPDGV